MAFYTRSDESSPGRRIKKIQTFLLSGGVTNSIVTGEWQNSCNPVAGAALVADQHHRLVVCIRVPGATVPGLLLLSFFSGVIH